MAAKEPAAGDGQDVRSDGPRDGRTPGPDQGSDPSASHPQSATRKGGRHETTTPGTVVSECGAAVARYLNGSDVELHMSRTKVLS